LTGDIALVLAEGKEELSSLMFYCDIPDAEDPELRKLAQGKRIYIQGIFKHDPVPYTSFSVKNCKVSIEQPKRSKTK